MDRFFEIEPATSEQQGPVPKRLALLIGNADYPGARLLNPTNDTRLLAAELEKLGFESKIVDDADADTLKAEIENAAAMLERAGSDTVFFFHYAGHGLQHKGRNYLLPARTALSGLDSLPEEAVSLDFLLDALGKGRQAASVIVLDACRKAAARTEVAGIPDGLAPVLNLPNGALIQFSTAAGRVAKDGAGRNSPYTELLADHLKRRDKTFSETFHNVSEALSRQSRGRQTPFIAAQAFPQIALSGDLKSRPSFDYRRLAGPLLGCAAGLALAAMTAPIAPPWLPLSLSSAALSKGSHSPMGLLTNGFEVLAVLTVLFLSSGRAGGADRGPSSVKAQFGRPYLVGGASVSLGLFAAFYLLLFSLFTYETPKYHLRYLKGFVCSEYANQPKYKDKCPLLDMDELADGEYKPIFFWTQSSITATWVSLVALWLAGYASLAVLIGCLVLHYIPGNEPYS